MTGPSVRSRRLVYGVGVNDSDYVTNVCPYYSVWANALRRCFSTKYQQEKPTYQGCTFEESWKTFSVFKAWMEQQDWQGKALDKDLLVQGNKHYGPNTCIFITPALNNLLTLRANDRGAYPVGVSSYVTKGCRYFKASCSLHAQRKTVGTFKTVQEASDCYKAAKLGHIATLAAAEPDPRIKAALLRLR